MGNIDSAKLAIVEFSDFECPYCKKFRNETLNQLKTEYIDTGKVILVYRDMPLEFHAPAAEKEVIAAECAREQGGDEIYYKYHDAIFKQTKGNGKGMDEKTFFSIATNLDLNSNIFSTCLKNEKYKDEITKDAQDAAKAGIRGTPGFIVGKLSKDGKVSGKAIKGAYPFSAFKNIIDEML